MRTRVGGLIAAGFIAAAGMAQDASPPTGGPAMAPPGPERFGPEMEARRQRREAEREADMALLLDLKPAQRPALHAYFADGRKPEGADRRPRFSPEEAPPSFTARLDERQAHLDRAMHDERERLAAARSFYAGLDAGQRARFEALQRLDHGHHGPGPMGDHGSPGQDLPGRPGPAGPPPGDTPPPPAG